MEASMNNLRKMEGVRGENLRAIPAGETLHWDGIRAASGCTVPKNEAQPSGPAMHLALPLTLSAFEARRLAATGQPAQPVVMRKDIRYVPACAVQAIDWQQLAVRVTFFVDPVLLKERSQSVGPRVRGEFVWLRLAENDTVSSPAVRPAVIVHGAPLREQTERIEMIPHFHATDPLFQHLMLVVRAASTAESPAGQLYAEALTNALATHFLKRYARIAPAVHTETNGLSPYKLRQITEHITTHLEQALSLTDLAAVVHMSSTYFARQFKQATGKAPHQYVLRCRIELAQRLLVETDLSLIEIGQQVGFTDQSHFTAVFRRHIGFTPRAYRENARRMLG